MLRTKRVCSLLTALALCLALTACGEPAGVGKADTGTGSSISDKLAAAQALPAETTPEPAAEETPGPTPEPAPEPLTFAEEHGWVFEAPHEVTVSVTQSAEADGLEIYPLSVTLGAPQITCSEPDEEGYVTYKVVYDSPSGLDLYFEGEIADDLGGNTRDYDLLDLYTGAMLPARLYLSLGEGQRYDDSAFGSVVECNGAEYEVFFGVEQEAEEPVQELTEEGSGSHLGYRVDTTITMTIRAPQEYDGLVLGLDFATPAEPYSEDEEEMEVTFWDEANDPADWTFVRLSDYCTPAETVSDSEIG